MIDSEVLKKLKDLPLRIQTASIKRRRKISEDIQEVLSYEECVNEQIVRGLCRTIQTTLQRYRDTSSRSYINNVLIKLSKCYKEWTLRHLTPVIQEVAEQLHKIATSACTAQSGLTALKWSTIMMSNTLANNTDTSYVDYDVLVCAQSKLLSVICSYGDEKINNKAFFLLQEMWKSVGGDIVKKYFEILGKQSDDVHAEYVVMYSALCKHYNDTDCLKECDQYKTKILQTFSSSLITTKKRPNINFVLASKHLLKIVHKNDFIEKLLPDIKRSLLRNPEIIMESVGVIYKTLDIGVDYDTGYETGKSFIASLPSKDDLVRRDAAISLEILSSRCSDFKCIKQLMEHLFAVYNGSNGKLTSSEHKIGVLQGAGNLSNNLIPVTERQILICEVSNNFSKVLESETHEKTLCYAIEMFSAWIKGLSGELPDYVFDMFKKLSGLKSATGLVKISYMQWLGNALYNTKASDKLSESIKVHIIKSVEKAIQQPQQVLVVSEGICALYVLVKLDNGCVLPTKHLNLWNAISNNDKHVLLQEKILTNATDDVLIQVIQLCTSILQKYNTSISAISPIHKALVQTMISISRTVRQTSIKLVKLLLCEVKSANIALELVGQLNNLLNERKGFSGKEKSPQPDDKAGDISGKMIADCIRALCSYTEYKEEDAHNLAREILKCSHHPLVKASAPDLWIKILKHMKIDPKRLILLHANTLKALYVNGYDNNETTSNIVSTLISINPDTILSSVVSYSVDILNTPELLKITRDEYFTYLTPEGEIYDKSSIPGSDDGGEMNMKRESKAYSYKDQLEELQLRRELEERRRKEGKQPPLTAKQKEAIKTQTAKEQVIRTRIAQLNDRLQVAINLLRSAAKGNGLEVSYHLKLFLPSLLLTLQSPLAARSVSTLYLELKDIVFSREFKVLADTIGHITLRQHKPQCDLDTNWEQEDLNLAMSRTIRIIHGLTSGFKLPEEDYQTTDLSKNHFTSPAFAYTFPLLKGALTSFYAKSDENMVLYGLQVIAHHAKLRGTGTKDLYHPALLPVGDIFKLLIDIIGNSVGRVQLQCMFSLLETANCASGRDGCYTATLEDVQCLLSGLQNPSQVVRDASLRALLSLVNILPELFNDPETAQLLTLRFWIAKYDESDENKQLAEQLWTQCGLDDSLSGAVCSEVLEQTLHPVEAIQRAAASSLPHALPHSTLTASHVLQNIIKSYDDNLALVPAKLDQLGHVVEEAVDQWWLRRGCGLALDAIATLLSSNDVVHVITFMVDRGLGDRHETVRDQMLRAAMAAVNAHGKDTVSNLLPVFETFLDKAPKSRSFDVVRQAVVLLMGSLARHLGSEDDRVKPICTRLISALSTPSQAVQEAVSDCLPHLITSPALKEDVPTIVNKLMKQLLTAEKYGDRKGAAYGLAGIVKGLGILALKQLDIMTKLTEAIQEKKNYRYREGALFALEMLCAKLGRLFEPYIVHVLPHLLNCFGDSSQYVRAATDDTSKVIMSKLSAHGVKLVLPSLLAALEDDSWRTKTGSVDLLGAMAFCAPKQLSSCLPSIVPALIEVLSDSHTRVQEAGAEALRVIGSVIRNPEIQAIVPNLLHALQDPSNKTSACLQTLLETQFVHFIDAPSLALIMPVVQRAFMDRSTETRKMAAQIIGNMYSLTDQKDLMPYLPNIIPGLKNSLLDPVPEVRSVSARALGAMVRGMGESSFEDLLPWLMQTLTSESSSVDRSGAAQGLSEVVAGLGVEKLHKLMPDIIATAERTDIAPHVKDGYIMMFIYMPGAFTDEFTPYIGQIINPILKALADENEYVRETALKAGQRIVNLYAESAITLLLPELEKGLFDDNWRIRYSSVQLLGDLLYRISGVTGKMSTETASEDDNFGTEQSHTAILRSLGAERRDRVLAGLYMGRSDVALMVRQAALHVWKVVVTNTPRTLKEILPTLFGLLLGSLASTSCDRRQVAARTMGDLVRKLGERVLPDIVPILEKGLESDRADRRQGVCIGLGEIVGSTSKETVLTFADGLIPTVRRALCDPLAEVRMAAAKTFDSLHATVGQKALDDVLPAMLVSLDDPDVAKAEAALDGLRQVMAIKSRAVLPYLVPQLTAPPPNTRALSALAAAAGDALAKHLHKVLPALLSALEAAADSSTESKELEQCRDALLPLSDETGVRCCVDSLLEATRTGSDAHKRAAASLLCAFVSHTRADLSPYVPQLLRGLISLLSAERRETLQMAYEALTALTKTLDSDRQIAHVSDVRQAVRYAAAELQPGQPLPGFCLPKGIAPILPLFRESILNGLPEDKENAALMLGEIIKLTSPEAIQPSVVHITGPLIRILGDRFNANVKAAVLETLALLLSKVGVMLKQFLPQLQTTFLKALNDPNRSVRLKAGAALSQLVTIHTRADPLFTEMHNGIKNGEDNSIRETTLQALRGVITSGGDKLSETQALTLLGTLTFLFSCPDEVPRAAAAGCVGALLRRLPEPHRSAALAHHVLTEASDPTLQHGRSCALLVALKESPQNTYDEQHQDRVVKAILTQISSDKMPVACNAVRSCGYLFKYLIMNDEKIPPNVLTQFVRCMNHPSNEVKQLVAQVCTSLGRSLPANKITPELMKVLVPALVNGTKEKNSFVKSNSESALISILRLREGDQVHQQCLQILEVGARESLNDVVSKVLRKVLLQPEGKEEELDCTLVT